ncbi:piggyBac transposable element-derived protein 4-like [Euwallacea fornicatus]|uniref:piggyBac transposable element-derived protein 4-like n=1 Tax=Euwallacea fornicatus TaxID=995702 RepID=UPI00338E0583
MYIPSKPCKYGIKIIMVCDSSSKYMLDASPYLGKSTKTNGLPLATYFVQELTKSVHGSNRNITMDNWFTSVSLADCLLKDPYKLTIIGTLRKNKTEIPKEMLDITDRYPNTSMFCHDQMKTMVSYMPKRKKIVLLLSTLHEGVEISSIGKPAIIMNYNETKGGVDTFDQMCSNMNSGRKTRRWPMVIFYDMINIACINSYIIYCSNLVKLNKKPLSRYQYMIELSRCLAETWLKERLNIKTLRSNIRQDINDILNISVENETTEYQNKKRKICFYCPSNKRRMTTTYCNQCKEAICGEHRGNNICIACSRV